MKPYCFIEQLGFEVVIGNTIGLNNDQLAEPMSNAPPIFSSNWTIKHQSHLVCKGGYGTG
jgi:hypothetical protein